MGIKGLTSYLKEHRRRLSYSLELSSKDSRLGADDAGSQVDDIRVIVDGWSLLYALYSAAGEPWVYGGEYTALARHVQRMLQAWKRVGIRPTFVFDGPSPILKYPTVISRLQESCVNRSILFFRTSKAARATPRMLADTRIAPPLGYTTVLSVLLSTPDLDVRFAEGEADTYIVALAGELGAFVMANDSDFMVLQCEGYKGYIPLEEMVWCTSVKDIDVRSSDTSLADEDSSDFQVVSRKKQKAKFKVKDSGLELGFGPLPPASHAESDLSLVLVVYEQASLAAHVSLPPTLLPLLGALIGNDYASFGFLRSNVSSADGVKRIADTLSSVIKDAQSGNAKKLRKIDRGGQGSVMDIIGTTVERLLPGHDSRYPPTNAQIDKITEKVVQSTLEYAVDSAALLTEHEHSDQYTDSTSQDPGNTAEQVQKLYLRAYHQGFLHARLMEVFARGTCFPRLFLEDPDRECCARSIGRPVRQVIWKLFAFGGGIPDRSEPGSAPEDNDAMADEDELVDVVEEESQDSISVLDDIVEGDEEEDPLAALRGKLQRLSFSVPSEAPEVADQSQPNTTTQSPSTSEGFLPSLRPKVVTEYVRRGARVVAEECEVVVLEEDLPWDVTTDPTPVQLRTLPERLNVFLKILGSDTPKVHSLADERRDESVKLRGGRLLVVVTLRWILQTLHARTEGLADGNHKREREREMEKWTRSEAEAFLYCLSEDDDEVELPDVEDRPIQLSAQVLSAFEAIRWLAEALLLVDLPYSGNANDPHLPVTLGEAEKAFSGRKFHAALIQRKKGSSKLFQQLWDASTEGLGYTFGDERGKKGKKERKERREQSQRADNLVKKLPGGMFGALEDLDVG